MSLDAAPDAAERLRDLIRSAMDGTADRHAAAERLLAQVRGDAELWHALMEPFERRAAAEAVGAMIREQRAKAWARPAGPDLRIAERVNAVRAALLDFPLPNGVRLRDATAPQLETAERVYGTRAADMGHKARWLARVRARLEAADPGATVGAVLGEAALRALQEETA